ncbi:MAG: biotin/lipoyl-binding protein, partial [Chromatiaceae bacterium]|nr:biotin/lipoyl-binding protein [Chromatiaceae bacterium]
MRRGPRPHRGVCEVKLIKSVATAVFVATFGQASALDNASGGFKVHEVSREAIPLTVSFAGTVTADKTLQLTAQMPGRIAEIAGKEGDRFGAGTVLVELDDSALLARLEAAIASRDSAAADIRNARVQFDRELYSPRSNSAGSAPGGMGMPAM